MKTRALAMKKKIILAIVCIAVLLCSVNLFSKTVEFSSVDGTVWKSYHDYAKLGFALGFIVGAHQTIDGLDPYIRQSYYKGEKVEELVPVYNITNTELRKKLDEFYEKKENLTVPVGEAAIIVCKEMIPKKDIKMISREKEILRLPEPERKVERIKDHIKKEIKKGKHPDYEVRRETIVKKETKKVIPLKSEEEVTDFWFNLLVPGGGVKTREVVKVNYSLAIIVAVFAGIVITFLMIRKGRRKK
ncbi:MAG: hypothetical protein ABIJ27_00295 [Candidatus Omnitrophota bacterium]